MSSRSEMTTTLPFSHGPLTADANCCGSWCGLSVTAD